MQQLALPNHNSNRNLPHNYTLEFRITFVTNKEDY